LKISTLPMKIGYGVKDLFGVKCLTGLKVGKIEN
jgi:hypothetical protein